MSAGYICVEAPGREILNSQCCAGKCVTASVASAHKLASGAVQHMCDYTFGSVQPWMSASMQGCMQHTWGACAQLQLLWLERRPVHCTYFFVTYVRSTDGWQKRN